MTRGYAAFAFLLVAIAVLGVLALGSKAAWPQDSHRENHDWLSKLRPNNGQGSCCSGDAEHGDCRVAQARQRPDGQWEAFYKGTLNPGTGLPLYWDWFLIPESKILRDELNMVPLHAWICEQNGFLYCFLKGHPGG